MPNVQTVTITYQYRTPSLEYLTYTTTIEKNTKFVVERAPFNIAGKRIVKYNSSASGTYLPGQIATASSNMTLTVPQGDGLEDIGYVKVHQGNTIVDVSDMVVNVVEKMGKNQPFSYVVISVLKELFIDANLALEQKSTIFDVNVYGIVGSWTYERLEDNGSTYDITIVNRAYYLKTTTLLSLLNFTINNSGDRITFTNIEPSSTSHAISWTSNPSSNTEYGSINFSKTSITSVVFTIKRVNIATSESPEYTYALIKIDGSPDNIFKFICNIVAGYTSFNIEAGQYHSKNPDSSYTTAQIEGMGTYTIREGLDLIFNSISLRLDQYCWNILETIALFTDRYICFDSSANLYPRYMNYNKYVIVDWEAPDPISPSDDYRHILALSSNDDQGSQYVLASQKVICEAYETTVSISDTNSTDVGADIVFASPDNTKIDITETDNETRDTQARIIALNSIVRNYKPGDCITYSICETVYPTTTLEDVTDLDNVPAPSGADQCFKYVSMLEGTSVVLHESYFVSQLNGSSYVWVEYDTDNPKREKAYNYNTCAYSVEDRQNNITILDAPIAMIQTEYPACVTTYTWGMPEFMDEQSQFKDLAAVAQDSVLDNTGDTQISSSDASKIVVGNQSISDLRSDRSGFTGLILEKNVDNQVYRLAGYNMGELQAEFNSLGEIQSGSGNVKIDHGGITLTGGVDIILDQDSSVYANHVALDSNGFTSYQGVTQISHDPDVFIPNLFSAKTVSIRGDGPDNGNIIAGGGAIEIGIIGNNNLVTKNGNTVQCYISNTGELMAGAGAVKLNSSGMGIYNGSTLQTQINTSGDIVAGGTIVLNGNGLIGYYNTPISTATRSIYISKTGSIAIGGNGGRTLQITGGQIKFFADGSVINSDGTVTGTTGAYITDTGMVTGLADNSVSTAQIVAEAVTNAKMALNSVDTAQIVDSAIKEAKLNDSAVTTNKIDALAVTTAKIDNSAITNAKIANASVSTAKIQDAAITTALIDNLAVTNAKIDNLSVGKIETGTLRAGSNIILSNTGSELLAGPYSTLPVIQLSTSTTVSGSYQKGTYVTFVAPVSNCTNFRIYRISYSPTISYDPGDWLIQQSPTEYGGILPGESNSSISVYIVFDYEVEGTTYSASAAIISTYQYQPINYRVRLNKDGFFTYNTAGDQVCSIDTTGNISGLRVSASEIQAGTISADSAIVLSNDNAEILIGPISYSPSDPWGTPVVSGSQNKYYKQGSYIRFYQPDGYKITLDSIRLSGNPYDVTWLNRQSDSEYGGIIPSSIADNKTLTVVFTYDISGTTYTSTQVISIRSSYIPASKFGVTIDKTGMTAGGVKVDADGLTVNYDASSGYVSANALKFYDTVNTWTPYKLYATYDSSTSTATSTVLAESKKNNGVITNPSKLKMVVDGGGVTGSFTSFTTNATATNTNISTITRKTYSNTNWEGSPSVSTTTLHEIPINNASYSYEIYVELTNTESPSVTITTPISPGDDDYYTDCAFIAYMANNTSFQFKSYDDNGSSARGTRYVFTSGSSPIIAVGIRVKGASNATFYLDKYPINIYISSGDGASILLDQEGTIIQGNNTINGQLYQSGGPIYFKGAGQNIPAYFDMPIVPLAVMSQGTVSGAAVISRNTTLASLSCRNIYIAPTGTTPSGNFNTGDIILYYT